MRIIATIVFLTFGTAMVMLSSTEALGQACDHGGNHVIQVRPDESDMPELSYRGGSAEEVRVCVGDSVQWVLTGSDRAFFIEFFGSAPFEGAAKRGSSNGVVSVIIGDVPRQSYDYGVEFAGGPPMDPRIIVD